MKVAVLMDALITLNHEKDTTLALIREALDLGYEVKVFTPSDWFWDAGKASAWMSPITRLEATRALWDESPLREAMPLDEFDIILMRQDPPVNQQYLYATYALEAAEREGVVVSNRPQSVRDLNEKFAITHFGSLLAPTLITQNMMQLRAFWERHQDVVFKPLDGFGGASVMRVDSSGQNLAVILELLTDKGARSIMAQRYVPEIKKTGDKRILMIHGEPARAALARMPSKDDWRGNLAAGAQGKVVPLTARDKEICAALSPFLKARALHLVGLDIIGDFLTEINVTSPTCLCEIQKQVSENLARIYWEGLRGLARK